MSETIKVALYTRVSTEDQARDGTSPEVQKENLERFAKFNNYEVYKVYPDKGYSGSTLDRPALKQMFEDARRKKFSIVLVYKVDRFARSIQLLTEAVAELEKIGVSFKSATEDFNNVTASGRVALNILGTFAQFERERIIERVFPGMVKGAMKGNWQGARYSPYGYDYNKEKKLLELVPVEADIVRAIYAMYLSGQTTSQITAYLYKKAYKTRTGRRFGSKLVCDILKNKLYTGKIVWNRRHYSKTEKTQHGLGAGQRYLEGDPSDIIESQGRHQPIITDEDYKRVQLRLGGNRKGIHRVFNKYEHILTGILKCAACGHSLFGHTNISNHRLKIRKKWYRCSLKAQTRSAECQEPNAVAEPLESFAFGILHKIASHSSIKEKRYNSLKKITTEPDDEILEQTQTAKKALKENRGKQGKLSETYLNGDIGKEVYNDRQEPLRREEEKLLKILDSLELKLIEKEQSKEYNNLLQSVLENFSETRENLTISEKKALLRLVFKEIIIKDGKLAGYELFEPFKTLLEEVQIEWQLKEIQGLTAKTEPVCTYARSVAR